MTPNNTYTTILSQLGLTSEQAEIYQSLLEIGPQTATKLSQNSSVQRTYIYNLSKQLAELGLVTIEKQGRTTLFTAQSPDLLLSLAETQKQKANQAQRALEGLLPSLKHKYALSEKRPVVTYYEGLEGIKKTYRDTLREGQPVLALVETSKVHPDVYSWVTSTYAKKRIDAGIHVKAIVASGTKTSQYTRLDEKELRETKVIPSGKFPLEHEINIYGNKLAIINHNKNQEILGIIIDNPIIANTFRSWFNLTWNSIK